MSIVPAARLGLSVDSNPPLAPPPDDPGREAEERPDLRPEARHGALGRLPAGPRRLAEDRRAPPRRTSVGIPSAEGIFIDLHVSKAGTAFAQSRGIASASAASAQPGDAASRTCSKLSRTAAAARARSAGFMFASPNMRIGLPLHVMASKPFWL